jgi:hypothetical protein
LKYHDKVICSFAAASDMVRVTRTAQRPARNWDKADVHVIVWYSLSLLPHYPSLASTVRASGKEAAAYLITVII